jgi:hypothetical protein
MPGTLSAQDTAEGTAHQVSALLEVNGRFDVVVEAVLRRLQVALSVPNATDDPVVHREFATARERLRALRPQFHDLHARILREHTSEAERRDLIAWLSDPRAQRFFSLQRAIAAETSRETATFSNRMYDAMLLGEPTSSQGPTTGAAPGDEP